MITAEISRFMDNNVHKSAYVVCLCQFGWEQWFGIFESSLAVKYCTFSSGRRKLVGNPASQNNERLQRRHSSIMLFFILAVRTLEIAKLRSIATFFGEI